jgi:hypothetical protein
MRKGIRKIIEELLEQDARCRNDDKWLTYKVFERVARDNGQGIFIPFNLFNKFPAFETIKRTRATIQNKEGKFLQFSAIIEKREKATIQIDPTRSMFRNSHLT